MRHLKLIQLVKKENKVYLTIIKATGIGDVGWRRYFWYTALEENILNMPPGKSRNSQYFKLI